jgi:hypothetical protein
MIVNVLNVRFTSLKGMSIGPLEQTASPVPVEHTLYW